MPKSVFVINNDWYYWSHRRPLALALIEQGYEVVLATRVGTRREQIEADGVRVHHLPLKTGSVNFLNDLFYLATLVHLYRREKPHLVYHVSFKPVLYGSVAAFLVGVPKRVNALAGLGHLFCNNNVTVRCVRLLVMAALRFLLNRPKSTLVLQNRCDYRQMKRTLRLPRNRIKLVRGAGVDTSRYSPCPLDNQSDVPVIVHVSRLIREKGVHELVSATRLLKQAGLQFRVLIVGDRDEGNPNPISLEELYGWTSEGLIEWLGHRDDIADIYRQADIAVLASYYREGVPKSLLEACACGLPIVTTDNPGCLEVVEHGRNGLIVPMRNSDAIAIALQRLIQDTDLRRKLSHHARQRAEAEFAEEIIVEQTLNVFGIHGQCDLERSLELSAA